MIYNVSIRTDIVNYYTPWLLNRLKEGYVYSRNPYDKHQVSKFDLRPEQVDAMIFCSKNYKPLLDHIDKINKNYNILCQYTITAYGKDVESNVPSIDESIETLTELSEIIGKERIAWRYDPILITDNYTIDDHLETFEYIASEINNYINYSIFSFVDMYRKVKINMPDIIPFTREDTQYIIKHLGKIANKYGIPIQTCLINEDLTKYGIRNSACVTTKILEEANNIKFRKIKHTGLRDGCRCVPTHDFGAYNTCPNQCKYCYANRNQRLAKNNYKLHNPESPLLLGKITEKDKITQSKNKRLLLRDSKQTVLF